MSGTATSSEDLGRLCMDGACWKRQLRVHAWHSAPPSLNTSKVLLTRVHSHLPLALTGNANLAIRHLSTLSPEDARAAVQSVDVDGRTPLHWAVSSRAFERDALRSLFNHGTSVAALDKGSGWTALHIATSASHAEAVDELIYQGADPNAKTPKGLTPLHYAASKGLTEIGRALLKAGALVNARDNAKQCPM